MRHLSRKHFKHFAKSVAICLVAMLAGTAHAATGVISTRGLTCPIDSNIIWPSNPPSGPGGRHGTSVHMTRPKLVTTGPSAGVFTMSSWICLRISMVFST